MSVFVEPSRGSVGFLDFSAFPHRAVAKSRDPKP